MKVEIPVENLYYLLCYAWDHLETRDLLKTAVVEGERPVDLLARLLLEGMRHVLRRGLDRGYVEYAEDLRSPRGKMDVTVTGKRALLSRPAVHCRFDELSHDVPQNRVIKATMVALVQSESLAGELRGDLMRTIDRLDDVTTVRPSNQMFRQVCIHRNNALYGLLIHVCELIVRNLLPDPAEDGAIRVRDFTGSSQEMGLMFEEFVRCFLRREQTHFKVDSPQISWDGGGLSESAVLRLPVMKSDVTLTSAAETVIIETKFYSEPLVHSHGGVPKVRSGHLYQLLSYVRNHAAAAPEGRRVRGILLYAETDRSLDLQYRIHGYDISVVSLGLAQPWKGIRADLLELARPCEVEASYAEVGA